MTARALSGRTGNLAQAPWGLVDQGVSAGTNVGLSLAVAGTVSAREFGAFSLVYVVYMVLLGLVRTTGTDVLAIRHAASPVALRRAAADATGYALATGTCAGLLCLAAAFLAPGQADLLLVLAVSFPLLLLQDAWRGVLLAQGDPRGALANDLTWAVVQFGLLAGCWAVLGALPTWAFLAVWGAGAAAGGLLGIVQTGVLPRVRGPLRWLRAHRALTLPLLATEALVQLPVQLVYLLLPLVTDLGQLGVLRATYLLFGPVGLVCQSIGALALPDAVRIADPRGVRTLAVRISLALAAVAACWSFVVLLLPDDVGRALVGESWTPSHGVRMLLAVSLVAESVLVGARVALAAWQRPRGLLRGRLASAPVLVGAGLPLAHAYGAAGLAGALALAYVLAAALSWREVLREPSASGDAPALARALP